MFKALVSGADKVNARPLYSNPFSFYNKAKLCFATNNLPEIKTKNTKDHNAFFNRLVLIPFSKIIPKEEQDKNLFEKLKAEIDYIFSWALEGLMEYISNGYKFSSCKASDEILDKYRSNSNTAQMFINDCCRFDNDSYIYKESLKKAFKEYCIEKGLSMPTPSDISYLQKLLEESYSLEYKKIHRGSHNKFGFTGLGLEK